MAKLPMTCPECDAFVRFDWTSNCGKCGAALVAPEVEPDANSPLPQGQHWSSPASAPNAPSQFGQPGLGQFAPQGPGAPRPRMSTGAKVAIALTVCGGFFLVVIFAAVFAIGFLGSSAKTKLDAAGNQIQSNQPITAADQAGIKALIPSNYYDSRWRESGNGYQVMTAAQLAEPSTCFPKDSAMKATSSVTDESSYNGQPNGGEGAHLRYAVLNAGSVKNEAHQFAQLSTPTNQNCLIDRAIETFNNSGKAGKTDLVPVGRNLAVPYIDYKITSNVTFKTGVTGTLSEEVIYLDRGPAHIRLVFDNCACSLGPPPDQDAIINHAVDALQAYNP